MKKLIIVSLCISVLCACGTMRGLQQQSSDKIHKTIKKNDEIYRLEKEGHSPDVKMKIIDKQHSRIYIPVEYIGKIEEIGDIPLFSDYTPDLLMIMPYFNPKDLSQVYGVECMHCILTETPNYLVIDINNKSKSIETFPVVYDPNIKTLEKLRKKQIIDFSFSVTPQKMKVSCNEKSCAILDENNQFVNKITINKFFSVNNKKVKELIAKEKEEEKKRLEEEKRRKEKQKIEREREIARQKREEAKWKKEWEEDTQICLAWRQILRQQKIRLTISRDEYYYISDNYVKKECGTKVSIYDMGVAQRERERLKSLGW